MVAKSSSKLRRIVTTKKKKKGRIWWAKGYCCRNGTNARIFVHELTDVYRGDGALSHGAHRCCEHLIKILDLRDGTRMRLGVAIRPSLSFRASRRVPHHDFTNTRKIFWRLIAARPILSRLLIFTVHFYSLPIGSRHESLAVHSNSLAIRIQGRLFVPPNSMKIRRVLWISL